MQILYAIILGMLQGVLEFLPVSSLGHLGLAERGMGLTHEAGLLFESMLHLGTMAALILVFYKDVRRLLLEFLGITSDLTGNLGKYVRKRRMENPSGIRYSKIITNVYRKMALMILVSMIPTMILGFACRNLAVLAFHVPSFTGLALLLMGVFLLVVDVSGVGGDYGPNSSRYDHALWIGILQGVSVFPGLSRCGLTIGTGLLCGFDKKFAIKYSFLCGIPAMLGAFLVEAPLFRSGEISTLQGFAFFFGAVSACITGYYTARLLIRLLELVRIKYFAGYCFLAGFLALIMSASV